MKLKTNLPKQSIYLIEFADSYGDAEPGWFIYLSDGWSFDPLSKDDATFISVEAKHEAMSLCVYQIEA